MCPTSQTLSLKRIGRGFHFGLFAACLVCVRCKFGISRVLSFCFHPGDPPRPPLPLAMEILEQGSDWKRVAQTATGEKSLRLIRAEKLGVCRAGNHKRRRNIYI